MKVVIPSNFERTDLPPKIMLFLKELGEFIQQNTRLGHPATWGNEWSLSKEEGSKQLSELIRKQVNELLEENPKLYPEKVFRGKEDIQDFTFKSANKDLVYRFFFRSGQKFQEKRPLWDILSLFAFGKDYYSFDAVPNNQVQISQTADSIQLLDSQFEELHTKKIVGRDTWINQQIESLHQSNILFWAAGPGMGKTAVAQRTAEIIDTVEDHYCIPYFIRKGTLSDQPENLYSYLGSKIQSLLNDDELRNHGSLEFENLLRSFHEKAPNKNLVLIIDGLDELATENYINQLPGKSYRQVTIIYLSRPSSPIRSYFLHGIKNIADKTWIDIPNLEDESLFILASSISKQSDELSKLIVKKSEGSPQYIELLGIAKDKGVITLEEGMSLPDAQSFTNIFYTTLIDRLYQLPDTQILISMLYTLAAAKEALELDTIGILIGKQEADIDKSLHHVRELLTIYTFKDKNFYSLYHESLREHLRKQYPDRVLKREHEIVYQSKMWSDNILVLQFTKDFRSYIARNLSLHLSELAIDESSYISDVYELAEDEEFHTFQKEATKSILASIRTVKSAIHLAYHFKEKQRVLLLANVLDNVKSSVRRPNEIKGLSRIYDENDLRTSLESARFLDVEDMVLCWYTFVSLWFDRKDQIDQSAYQNWLNLLICFLENDMPEQRDSQIPSLLGIRYAFEFEENSINTNSLIKRIAGLPSLFSEFGIASFETVIGDANNEIRLRTLSIYLQSITHEHHSGKGVINPMEYDFLSYTSILHELYKKAKTLGLQKVEDTSIELLEFLYKKYPTTPHIELALSKTKILSHPESNAIDRINKSLSTERVDLALTYLEFHGRADISFFENLGLWFRDDKKPYEKIIELIRILNKNPSAENDELFAFYLQQFDKHQLSSPEAFAASQLEFELNQFSLKERVDKFIEYLRVIYKGSFYYEHKIIPIWKSFFLLALEQQDEESLNALFWGLKSSFSRAMRLIEIVEENRPSLYFGNIISDWIGIIVDEIMAIKNPEEALTFVRLSGIAASIGETGDAIDLFRNVTQRSKVIEYYTNQPAVTATTAFFQTWSILVQYEETHFVVHQIEEVLQGFYDALIQNQGMESNASISSFAANMCEIALKNSDLEKAEDFLNTALTYDESGFLSKDFFAKVIDMKGKKFLEKFLQNQYHKINRNPLILIAEYTISDELEYRTIINELWGKILEQSILSKNELTPSIGGKGNELIEDKNLYKVIQNLNAVSNEKLQATLVNRLLKRMIQKRQMHDATLVLDKIERKVPLEINSLKVCSFQVLLAEGEQGLIKFINEFKPSKSSEEFVILILSLLLYQKLRFDSYDTIETYINDQTRFLDPIGEYELLDIKKWIKEHDSVVVFDDLMRKRNLVIVDTLVLAKRHDELKKFLNQVRKHSIEFLWSLGNRAFQTSQSLSRRELRNLINELSQFDEIEEIIISNLVETVDSIFSEIQGLADSHPILLENERWQERLVENSSINEWDELLMVVDSIEVDSKRQTLIDFIKSRYENDSEIVNENFPDLVVRM